MTTERVATAGIADDGTPPAPMACQERIGASPRVVTSDSLLAGASQLAILHKQTVYFLRQTRFGKLILTK
jgi:hemin uptake protein HemP